MKKAKSRALVLRQNTHGFSKQLPGDDMACVKSPSWMAYPANALLHAGRTGTILVNDNPDLPMPSVGGADLKNNAKQLATIMALETVQFVFPNIRRLTLRELAEFRAEAKDVLNPFRRAMLTLSKELNTKHGWCLCHHAVEHGRRDGAG